MKFKKRLNEARFIDVTRGKDGNLVDKNGQPVVLRGKKLPGLDSVSSPRDFVDPDWTQINPNKNPDDIEHNGNGNTGMSGKIQGNQGNQNGDQGNQGNQNGDQGNQGGKRGNGDSIGEVLKKIVENITGLGNGTGAPNQGGQDSQNSNQGNQGSQDSQRNQGDQGSQGGQGNQGNQGGQGNQDSQNSNQGNQGSQDNNSNDPVETQLKKQIAEAGAKTMEGLQDKDIDTVSEASDEMNSAAQDLKEHYENNGNQQDADRVQQELDKYNSLIDALKEFLEEQEDQENLYIDTATGIERVRRGKKYYEY